MLSPLGDSHGPGPDLILGWLTGPDLKAVLGAIHELALTPEGQPLQFDMGIFDVLTRAGAARPPPAKLGHGLVGRLSAPSIEGVRVLPWDRGDVGSQIPRFYGAPNADAAAELAQIQQLVSRGLGPSVPPTLLGPILEQYSHLPACFAGPIVRGRALNRERLKPFWERVVELDDNARLFRFMVGFEREHGVPDDITPFARAIIESHPSLAFLASDRVFLERFVEFVTTRIFYCLDTQLRGTFSVRDVKKCDLAGLFMTASKLDDVNERHHAFNYRNFYVVFCKFWELLSDQQGGCLQLSELRRFAAGSINPIIVDRFFAGDFFPRNQCQEGVDFRSFAYWMMSVVDKTSPTAVHLWWRLLDGDNDGILSVSEIETAYQAQQERIRSLGHETVEFSYVYGQVRDLFNAGGFKLRDAIRPASDEILLTTLVDMQGFLTREYEGPPTPPPELQELSPWDIYVMGEYELLVSEAGEA